MKRIIALSFILFCLSAMAQTKFAGVPLNISRQDFCEKMSQKFTPVFYGNGKLNYFLFTFLGIDNCRLNVNGGENVIICK